MIVRPHLWRVELALHPALPTVSFEHISQHTGHQVLDSLAWPVSPDVKTERAYLAELYDAVLSFMEVRA